MARSRSSGVSDGGTDALAVAVGVVVGRGEEILMIGFAVTRGTTGVGVGVGVDVLVAIGVAVGVEVDTGVLVGDGVGVGVGEAPLTVSVTTPSVKFPVVSNARTVIR
jgi:hypothetical protein